MNYLGFPVFITGTTDKQRRFHHFEIALLQNEDTASFKFVFWQSLKKSKSTYQLTILVADTAPAITSAFEDVFGTNYTKVYCWIHVKKNIDQKLKPSPILFQCTSKYFLTKWRKYEEAQSFIEIFEKKWIHTSTQ